MQMWTQTFQAKGTVVFKVANKGRVAHDFKINGRKTPLVASGKSATLTVKFAKTGNSRTSAPFPVMPPPA